MRLCGLVPVRQDQTAEAPFDLLPVRALFFARIASPASSGSLDHAVSHDGLPLSSWRSREEPDPRFSLHSLDKIAPSKSGIKQLYADRGCGCCRLRRCQHPHDRLNEVIRTLTPGFSARMRRARSWPDIRPGITRSVKTSVMSPRSCRMVQASSAVVALMQVNPNAASRAADNRSTRGSSSTTRTSCAAPSVGTGPAAPPLASVAAVSATAGKYRLIVVPAPISLWIVTWPPDCLTKP